jgi:hypothetical protein
MPVIFRVDVQSQVTVSESTSVGRRISAGLSETMGVGDSLVGPKRLNAELYEALSALKPSTLGAGNDYLIGLESIIRALGGIPNN